MKQPKKLTRQQKILLSNVGLDPDKYMLRQDLMRTIVVSHKETGAVEIIEK
ncbi:MAG: DUF6906 family protein [Butyricicoccaceae bacterium]